MASKTINVSERIAMYDENFINSISLKNVKNNKELKELVSKLEIASYVVTTFYQMLYNDYIMYINNDNCLLNSVNLETVKRYKNLAKKVNQTYNYINYMFIFENPFK